MEKEYGYIQRKQGGVGRPSYNRDNFKQYWAAAPHNLLSVAVKKPGHLLGQRTLSFDLFSKNNLRGDNLALATTAGSRYQGGRCRGVAEIKGGLGKGGYK